MRFSAAIKSQQPLRTPAANELVRRFVRSEPVKRSEPAPPRADELPVDLDQRVRLIGEW